MNKTLSGIREVILITYLCDVIDESIDDFFGYWNHYISLKFKFFSTLNLHDIDSVSRHLIAMTTHYYHLSSPMDIPSSNDIVDKEIYNKIPICKSNAVS